MRQTTVTIGNIAEAHVLAALCDKFYTVLIPYGGGCRYDLLIDNDGQFTRVQCKNGCLRNGRILFKTCSVDRNWSGHSSKERSYTADEIDAFGVYCPELGTVYLVPLKDCATSRVTLRINPPRNGQTKGIRYASDYLLTRVSTLPD